MFLHVDESGNSGNNLFDPDQPVLTYGVLSSPWNVDSHATKEYQALLNVIKADSLHASRLGPSGLAKIADSLVALHEQFEFHFDFYFIHKPSFAVVTFFNAVCDAGINPAMKWDWYWTPLRFPLIAVLDDILDERLLRESWRLCLVPNAALKRERKQISALLTEVLERLQASDADARLIEILEDALRYGIREPLEMDFGIYSPTALSPNTIGFQFVLTAIAYRQKLHRQKALGIVVDRQTQFNGAQVTTYDIQSKVAATLRSNETDRERYLAQPFLRDVRHDTETLIAHFPEERLTIRASNQSIGLQLTDTYLWLMNRFLKEKEIPEKLEPLVESIMSEDMVDGISMPAMMMRWRSFEQKLPAFKDVSAAHRAAAQEHIDNHRQRVDSMRLK